MKEGKQMNKELEALQKLRDLVEYLTRVDYVPTDLRNEVKELLIKSYEDSNGYFSQIEKALKRNEPMKVKRKTYLTDINCDGPIGLCPNCNRFVKDIYRRCPDCGQVIDWSDEK